MRAILWFFIFMTLWVVGCAIHDYLLMFEAPAYTMAWGFFVGAVSHIIANEVSSGLS